MLYVLMIAIGLGELILQLSVLPLFAFVTTFPNIILVTCVLFFVLLDFNFSFTFAFACGLTLDLFSRAPFGTLTAGIFLALFVVRLFSEKYISKHTFFSTPLLVVIATVVHMLFVNGILLLAYAIRIIDYTPNILDTVVRNIPLVAVWNVVVMALLWRPLGRLSPMVQYFQHRAKNL